MATLTVRNFDDTLKQELRLRAARHGHSMEEEVRQILRQVLSEPDADDQRGLGDEIRALFSEIGWWEMELPERERMPLPLDLSGD